MPGAIGNLSKKKGLFANVPRVSKRKNCKKQKCSKWKGGKCKCN